MRPVRLLLFCTMLALFTGGGHSLLGDTALEAVQAPRISVDMDPAGNTYDGGTMLVGTVDNCLTANEANNSQHFHTAHLVIHQVEDLVGWQARLHYDGARMRPATVNFTPFRDTFAGQDVSFVNLPADSITTEHRSLITATDIPAPPSLPVPTPQTALIGSSYSGEQTAAFSPDTPAKTPPDDYSYSAPNGGVLAAIDLQVRPTQAGQPSLYIDLDNGAPNGPGSNLVLFTGTGATTLSLAENSLVDGFHGEGADCIPFAPPPPPAPPQPPSPPPPPAGSADSGETSAEHCPNDPNADHWIDVSDIALIGSHFGKAVPPAPVSYDISPSLVGDGYVDISDVAAVGARFGQNCIGNSSTISDPPPPEPPPEGFGPAPQGIESSAFIPRVYGCRLRVEGHNGLVVNNWIQIGVARQGEPWNDWGGEVFCYTNAGFEYRFTCMFQWMQIRPGPTGGNIWVLVVSGDQVTTQQAQPNAYGGQFCTAYPNLHEAGMPCQYQTLGWVSLYVEYRRPGYPWHSMMNIFEPEQGYGFEPCYGI